VPDSLEIRSLKEEVMQHFEDDRRLRNIRFNEIYNLIEQNKAMQTELITQQFDSQKALMKAIVNKETAERMLADEELQNQLTQGLRKLKVEMRNNEEINALSDKQHELENKIDATYDALTMKFKNSQVENEALIDELQQLLNN